MLQSQFADDDDAITSIVDDGNDFIDQEAFDAADPEERAMDSDQAGQDRDHPGERGQEDVEMVEQ